MKTRILTSLLACLCLCGVTYADTPTDVAKFLANAPIPEGLRDAMQAAVKSQPDASRWSGEYEGQLFAVVAAPVPKDKRFRVSTLQRLEVLAKYELLLTKAVLDTCREAKLDDLPAIKNALRKTQGTLDLTGKSQGVLWKTQVVGQTCAAYAYADAAQLKANLKTAKNLAAVQENYREEIHGRMKEQMETKQWGEAVTSWEHLHQRHFLSPALHLDAAGSYVKLGQKSEAKIVLDEAAKNYISTSDDEFYEKLGDLYLEVQDEASATKMFDHALEFYMAK